MASVIITFIAGGDSAGRGEVAGEEDAEEDAEEEEEEEEEEDEANRCSILLRVGISAAALSGQVSPRPNLVVHSSSIAEFDLKLRSTEYANRSCTAEEVRYLRSISKQKCVF